MKVPGDVLALSEEFAAGSGAFEHDGKVYSEIVGKELVDAATARMVNKPDTLDH